MRINQNIASLSAQNANSNATRQINTSLQKLSTGLRINSASDDAAGLGVSENLRKQVRGLDQALKNTQDAIALLSIADGALNEEAGILQRMRELVVQARNDTYTQTERNYMGKEFTQLMTEIDRIAEVTNYNGMRIFAAPEATPGDSRRYTTSTATEPRRLQDQGTLWDAADEATSAIFGADDNSSATYFNMMIGSNFTSADSTAYNNDATRQSFDPTARNMITIELGQMDANGVLSLNPSTTGGNVLGDGGPGGNQGFYTGTNDDNAFSWDIANGNDATISVIYHGDLSGTVQDKLDLLQKLIDGKNSDIVTNAFSTAILRGAGNVGNVTGIERVNRMRANIGAIINRLEHSVNNTMNQISSTQAAESLVRDVDFANETATYTRNQIMVQSSSAMLSQANLQPQMVLRLLQ